MYWHRRSHAGAIPASHASPIFHDLRSGKEGEGASIVYVELDVVLPQDMFHLRIGAKQLLAAEAHRAVVNGPSDFCIIRTCGAQAIVSKHQLMKSPAAWAPLSRQYSRRFALRGVTFEKRERKAEGQARANLVHRVSARERVTYRDVEAEIVAHAVNQADQA